MTKNNSEKIPKRILSSIITSLSAGVVPRTGAPYIAIGRGKEIEALLSDLEAASDGGASIRFLIGRYGSGKSFLMQLIRGYALERGFVSADCELTPERKLYGANGSGIKTYRELIKNLATKATPEGGALEGVISRFLSDTSAELLSDGIAPSSSNYTIKLNERIYSKIKPLQLSVGGFDFSAVLTEYVKAKGEGDDSKAASCLRFLRGEYATKTEARQALGFSVSGIADDDNWYDYIKLWAEFVRLAGYRGLVVFIDECVNLYKIPNRISRENNYEKLLSMFNDALGARAHGLSLVFGGTPQFLEDTRRGLFGYEALRSRLCDSSFAGGKYQSFLGPVIRLKRLSGDELLALVKRLSFLYSLYKEEPVAVTDGEMENFVTEQTSRAGASELITPREIIRDFLFILSVMSSDKSASFTDIAASKQSQPEAPAAQKVEFNLEEMEI
jgi:hypothetical protein